MKCSRIGHFSAENSVSAMAQQTVKTFSHFSFITLPAQQKTLVPQSYLVIKHLKCIEDALSHYHSQQSDSVYTMGPPNVLGLIHTIKIK